MFRTPLTQIIYHRALPLSSYISEIFQDIFRLNLRPPFSLESYLTVATFRGKIHQLSGSTITPRSYYILRTALRDQLNNQKPTEKHDKEKDTNHMEKPLFEKVPSSRAGDQTLRRRRKSRGFIPNIVRGIRKIVKGNPDK